MNLEACLLNGNARLNIIMSVDSHGLCLHDFTAESPPFSYVTEWRVADWCVVLVVISEWMNGFNSVNAYMEKEESLIDASVKMFQAKK